MVSKHCIKASCKSNPGILLPDPFPIPSSSKLNNWRLDGCDVYITLEPCPMCASALKQARVSHIFCGLSNSDFRNYEIVLKILESDKNNASVPIINDLAVEKVDKIMKDFFRNRRNS